MCVLFQTGKPVKKWTSYFDYVGVDARKPLFFGEGINRLEDWKAKAHSFLNFLTRERF